MKLYVGYEDLQKGMQAVEKAVSTRSTLPIISNILIEAEKGGKLKLSGNDLEIGVEVNLSATIERSGAILAPAKTLSGIISKLPREKVFIEVDDSNNIKIECNRSKFNIRGITAIDFPRVTRLSNAKNIKLNKNILGEMIKRTLFSVSTDESKQVLNGILFDINKEDLCLVATDGYRLALKRSNIGRANSSKVSIIVPNKALSELVRMIKEGDEDEVELGICNDQISFDLGDIYIISRLIQGKFPDYNLVIPKESKTSIEILRKDFLEATERSAVIASMSANIIKLEVSDGKLLITASSSEVGSVSELLDVSISGKSRTKISFNVRLILDVLRNMEDDYIEMSLGEDELSAGVIKAKGKMDYTYVLMPIRTVETVKV